MNENTNLVDFASVKKERESMDAHSKETAAVINWLFKELRANFTAFKQAWPDQTSYEQAKKTWLKAFVLAGIKDIESISMGLDKCYLMENPFVPSPGEFISWCKPSASDLGFPSIHQAFNFSTLINSQFSDYKHSDARVDFVIRHVIRQIGAIKYRGMSEENARKTFDSYYTIALRDYLEGNLKEISQMLEDNSAITKEESIKKAVIKEEYKGIGKESALSAMKKLLK